MLSIYEILLFHSSSDPKNSQFCTRHYQCDTHSARFQEEKINTMLWKAVPRSHLGVFFFEDPANPPFVEEDALWSLF